MIVNNGRSFTDKPPSHAPPLPPFSGLQASRTLHSIFCSSIVPWALLLFFCPSHQCHTTCSPSSALHIVTERCIGVIPSPTIANTIPHLMRITSITDLLLVNPQVTHQSPPPSYPFWTCVCCALNATVSPECRPLLKPQPPSSCTRIAILIDSISESRITVRLVFDSLPCYTRLLLWYPPLFDRPQGLISHVMHSHGRACSSRAFRVLVC